MTLREVCLQYGGSMPTLLHNGIVCQGALVLWVFAGVETSYGRDRLIARREPAYFPGGAFYQHSSKVQALYAKYGEASACSYGSWQMMFSTAVDLGFEGMPTQLQDDSVLAPLVTRYFLHQQPGTLENAADAYNSGSWRDTFIPVEYVAKIIAAYELGWTVSA